MMKSQIVLSSLALACLPLSAQQLSFDHTSHDFGGIAEADGRVSHDFTFTNTGDAPLLITDVICGCGCTSARWSAEAYAPGQSGIVRISYEPEGRKARSFSIVSEVFSNAGEPVALTVDGEVALMQRPYVNFFDPTQGEASRQQPTQPTDDYELILQRVRERIFASIDVETLDKNATSLMKMLTPEGIWPDIDYACRFRTNWDPLRHLNNVKRMCTALANPASGLYGHPVLFRAVDASVRAWNKYQPQSYNWWYNQIAAPKVMADILALLEGAPRRLKPVVVQPLIDMMAKSDPREWTGANKQDIAIHHLLRGCVLKSDSIVSTNAAEFFEPVSITDFEGIREDMSYQQHRRQLYIGGYGTVFIDNIARMAPLLAGTRFAMSQEKTELFSRFVRETYLNVFRGRYMDFSVCGRSVSRPGNLEFASAGGDLFATMAQLDPAHADEYTAASRRFAQGGNPAAGRSARNCWYYNSDYMLHNRPHYDFSVRAVSKQTCRSESGNGENLLGGFLSEGATSIRVSGAEYADIFPVWEWDRIPGTTLPRGERPNHNEWGVDGCSDFVDGCSDGSNGVMAYAMDDYGVQARKAWFMFDRQIVCLGAGIKGDSLFTTLNQCHLSSEVYLKDAEGLRRLAPESAFRGQFKGYVWHGKVAYYLPEESEIELRNGVQTGSWSRINFNQPTTPVSKPVFNFAISHGDQADGSASYAYVILPAIASPAALEHIDAGEVEIVSNSSQCQLVVHKRLGLAGAVFYEPCSVSWEGHEFSSDKAGVMLFRVGSTKNVNARVAPDMTGFSLLSHFSHSFKKHFGVSPTNYELGGCE